MLQKMPKKAHTHQKHTPCHQGLEKMQQKQQQKHFYTYGTINGCSPHPPSCVWVGWVLF